MRIRIKRKLKESSSSGGMTGYAGVPLSTKEEVDEFMFFLEPCLKLLKV